MMHHTQRAARYEGRKAFEEGREMMAANPYHHRTKSHYSFEAGYREARREAALAEREG